MSSPPRGKGRKRRSLGPPESARSAGGTGASAHPASAQRSQDGPAASSPRNMSNKTASLAQLAANLPPARPTGGSTHSGDHEAVSMYQHWSSDNTVDYSDACQDLDLDRLIDDWHSAEPGPNVPSNSRAVGVSGGQSRPIQGQTMGHPAGGGSGYQSLPARVQATGHPAGGGSGHQSLPAQGHPIGHPTVGGPGYQSVPAQGQNIGPPTVGGLGNWSFPAQGQNIGHPAGGDSAYQSLPAQGENIGHPTVGGLGNWSLPAQGQNIGHPAGGGPGYHSVPAQGQTIGHPAASNLQSSRTHEASSSRLLDNHGARGAGSAQQPRMQSPWPDLERLVSTFLSDLTPSSSRAVGGSAGQSLPAQGHTIGHPATSSLQSSRTQEAGSSRLLDNRGARGAGSAQQPRMQPQGPSLQRGASALPSDPVPAIPNRSRVSMRPPSPAVGSFTSEEWTTIAQLDFRGKSIDEIARMMRMRPDQFQAKWKQKFGLDFYSGTRPTGSTPETTRGSAQESFADQLGRMVTDQIAVQQAASAMPPPAARRPMGTHDMPQQPGHQLRSRTEDIKALSESIAAHLSDGLQTTPGQPSRPPSQEEVLWRKDFAERVCVQLNEALANEYKNRLVNPRQGAAAVPPTASAASDRRPQSVQQPAWHEAYRQRMRNELAKAMSAQDAARIVDSCSTEQIQIRLENVVQQPNAERARTGMPRQASGGLSSGPPSLSSTSRGAYSLGGSSLGASTIGAPSPGASSSDTSSWGAPSHGASSFGTSSLDIPPSGGTLPDRARPNPQLHQPSQGAGPSAGADRVGISQRISTALAPQHVPTRPPVPIPIPSREPARGPASFHLDREKIAIVRDYFETSGRAGEWDEVAPLVGTNAYTLHATWVSEVGMPPVGAGNKGPGNRLTPEEFAKVREMLVKGFSWAMIASKLKKETNRLKRQYGKASKDMLPASRPGETPPTASPKKSRTGGSNPDRVG